MVDEPTSTVEAESEALVEDEAAPDMPSPLREVDLSAPFTVTQIALDDIHQDPNIRPRLEGIDELAAGISARGLLHPVVVRRADKKAKHGKTWVLVAGYRRCAAFRELEQKTIPAVEQELDDASALAARVVENMQRHQLDPVAQAYAMQQMIDLFGWRPVDVAKALGVHRSQVTKSLKLLALPEPVLTKIADKEITRSHAEALMSLDTPEEQVEVADLAARSDMSVTKTASYVRQIHKRKEEETVAEEKAEIEAKAAGSEIVKVDEEMPLKILVSTDAVALPYFEMKDKPTADEFARLALWKDLNSNNDIEVQEYLAEVHGIEREEWWLWVSELPIEEVREYHAVLLRRWYQSASRFPRLPARLVYQLGRPTTTEETPLSAEPLQLGSAGLDELPAASE